MLASLCQVGVNHDPMIPPSLTCVLAALQLPHSSLPGGRQLRSNDRQGGGARPRPPCRPGRPALGAGRAAGGWAGLRLAATGARACSAALQLPCLACTLNHATFHWAKPQTQRSRRAACPPSSCASPRVSPAATRAPRPRLRPAPRLQVGGLPTNLEFMRRICEDEEFQQARPRHATLCGPPRLRRAAGEPGVGPRGAAAACRRPRWADLLRSTVWTVSTRTACRARVQRGHLVSTPALHRVATDLLNATSYF